MIRLHAKSRNRLYIYVAQPLRTPRKQVSKSHPILVAEAYGEFSHGFGPIWDTALEICKHNKRTSLQKATTSLLLPRLFPGDLPQDMVRRIELWAPFQEPDDLLERVNRSIDAVQSFPASFKIALYKVWCNGVPTSKRKGDDDLGCRFFCPASSDHFRHYCQCQNAALLVQQHDRRMTATDPLADSQPLNVLALCPLASPVEVLHSRICRLYVLVDTLQNLSSNLSSHLLSLQLENSARSCRLLSNNRY